MYRFAAHAVFWVAVLALGCTMLLSAFDARESGGEARLAALKAPRPDNQDGFGFGETVIERGPAGQFHLDAFVNGEPTEFLIDTGSDIVALTMTDAERIGVDVAPEDLRPIMRTASGTGNGARIKLDRLELGNEEFRDIGAVVVEGLEVNLLGQSVLRRLGKVELRGDRMIIEHR
jgi:aspartyl protease family protein